MEKRPINLSLRRTAGGSGYRPIQVGRDEGTILIDPKDAFGDGRHPSTRVALDLLDDLLNGVYGSFHIAPQWGLDAGCGSGILSLAAATLGDFKVFAVDIDPSAVETAACNIEKNPGAGSKIYLTVGDLSCARGPFGLVLANLAPSVHFRVSDTLWEAAAPGGWLILSGFFEIQKHMVLGPYLRKGAASKGISLNESWVGSLLYKPRSEAQENQS